MSQLLRVEALDADLMHVADLDVATAELFGTVWARMKGNPTQHQMDEVGAKLKRVWPDRLIIVLMDGVELVRLIDEGGGSKTSVDEEARSTALPDSAHAHDRDFRSRGDYGR